MGWGTSLSMLIQFIFCYTVLFFLMPSAIENTHPEDRRPLDRWFITLVHSNLFFIAAVHLLAFIKLYEVFSLYFVCVMAAIFAHKVRNRGKSPPRLTEWIAELYDLSDNSKEWRVILRSWAAKLSNAVRRTLRSVRHEIRLRPALWLGIAAAVAYGMRDRLAHAWSHLYFGAADPYVHMKWALELGMNKLYADGVYMYGFEAVLIALSTFFNVDLYVFMRYMGPWTGFLILLSIVYAVGKLTGIRKRDWFPAGLAGGFAALFLYVANPELPAYVWRQYSALSMEYGLIFFLPGIVFMTLYARSGARRYLVLAAETLTLTVLIHLYAGFLLAISYFIIGLFSLPQLLRRKDVLRTALWIVPAGLLGGLPMIIGVLAGITMDTTYVVDNVKTTVETSMFDLWKQFREPEPTLRWLTGASALVLVGALGTFLLPKARRNSRASLVLRSLSAFAGLHLVLYAMFRTEALGLPAVMAADRLGVFYAVYGAFFAGLALAGFVRVAKHGRGSQWISLGVCLALVPGLLLGMDRPSATPGDRYQYDEAVEAYFKIRDSFEPRNWYVISPVDEMTFVLKHGIHDNIWYFVSRLEDLSVERVEYPVDDIFIFVELVPLGSDRPVSEEAAMQPFPVADISDLTKFYYRTPEHRYVLQSKAYAWAERFRSQHPEEMTIFMDTPHFRVYRIHQENRMAPLNLKL